MLTKYISHAAGGIKGVSYTNSKEAFDLAAKKGFKFIELDITETRDGEYVLIHDWYKTRKRLFGKRGKVTKKHFLKDKMVKGLTPMSLDMAMEWLRLHPKIYFVSDVKKIPLIDVLKYVAEKYPDLIPRFIPQIYFFDEYDKAKKLGFQEIIFILYLIRVHDRKILNFIKQHKLLAVAMSKKRALRKFALSVKQLGVKTIVFTVNDKKEQKEFEALGVDSFFTDDLY